MLKGINVFCCCNIVIDFLFKCFLDIMKILLILIIMWISYVVLMKGFEGMCMCLFFLLDWYFFLVFVCIRIRNIFVIFFLYGNFKKSFKVIGKMRLICFNFVECDG